MAINKADYAPDWKDISLAIREREQDRCKFCGVENHAEIVRSTANSEQYLIINEDGEYVRPNGDSIRMSEIPDDYLDGPLVKVVLTVAHLDQDTRNDDLDNLAALCQRCHLNYDKQHNVVKAKRTRLDNKRQAIADSGQLSFLD